MKSIIRLAILVIAMIGYSYADDVYADRESGIVNSAQKNTAITDTFQNDLEVLELQQQEQLLRNSYISPYSYLQNPIAINMGLDIKDNESGAKFGLGLSVDGGANIPLAGQNKSINTEILQIWGQSGRFAGFAFGAGGTAVLNFTQIGQPNTYSTTSVFTPDQAYIDYQYSNKLQISAGNILLNTPWVNSIDNSPGSVYAFGNNSYQGSVVNIQALPSLLITGFYAWQYLQYPNNWFNHQTLYNTSGGVYKNLPSTAGPAGIGLNWNPVKDYSGQLWGYNFADYANMVYTDNKYHVPIGNTFSFDFAGQGFMQSSSGSAVTNQIVFPGQTSPAGDISSNGVGGKVGLNIANNTSSISYNKIFSSSGSYLNGGMVTPYTFGLETDPLYTTPALNSIAELGSGSAYTIRNSTAFMDSLLKFSLSYSQFFVNQVYSTQPNLISEYDGTLLYRIPHSTMNLWLRLVYLDKGPNQYGGKMWQPRINMNWYF